MSILYTFSESLSSKIEINISPLNIVMVKIIPYFTYFLQIQPIDYQ